jgi:hypothetical protein
MSLDHPLITAAASAGEPGRIERRHRACRGHACGVRP